MPSGVASGINPKRAGGGGGGLLGQVLITTHGSTDIPIPKGTTHAFLEAVGAGAAAGSAGQGGAYASGGGAGADVIKAIAASDVLSASLANGINNAPSTILLNGVTILTANSGTYVHNSPTGSGGLGKYPGTNGTPSGVAQGKGGGRLGGPGGFVAPTTSLTNIYPGIGGGCYNNLQDIVQMTKGAVCATFFTSEAAAITFANSCYNGAWVP